MIHVYFACYDSAWRHLITLVYMAVMWSHKCAQSVRRNHNWHHTNAGSKVANLYTAITEQHNDSNVHLHIKVNQDYISISSSSAYFIIIKQIMYHLKHLSAACVIHKSH